MITWGREGFGLYAVGKPREKTSSFKRVSKSIKRRSVEKANKAARVSALRQKLLEMTPAERRFEDILLSLGIKYHAQHLFGKKEIFSVDFYLPEYHMVVEVDGGYHDEKEQIEKDRRRDLAIKKYGNVARIVRFTNEDIFSPDAVRMFLLRAFPFLTKVPSRVNPEECRPVPDTLNVRAPGGHSVENALSFLDDFIKQPFGIDWMAFRRREALDGAPGR